MDANATRRYFVAVNISKSNFIRFANKVGITSHSSHLFVIPYNGRGLLLMIKYFFRRPKYPILCNAQEVLIGAENHDQLEEQINRIQIITEEQLSIIESSNEGWVLETQLMVVSLLSIDKVWTKKKIIELFNKSRAAKKLGIEYPLKSLQKDLI
jgi:hypothetical protein